MRKGSAEVIRAFLAGKRRTIKSTSTDGERLTLHGNTIAWCSGPPELVASYHFTLAGWDTVTTRERLNTFFELLGVRLRVYKSKHVLYAYNYVTDYKEAINYKEAISAHRGYAVIDFPGTLEAMAARNAESAMREQVLSWRSA
jgi:hypothetical protein